MMKKCILIIVLLSLTFIWLMSGLVPRVYAATFTVTNTNDSGTGSLRWAITQANTNPGSDTIEFAIPGEGVQTISLASGLPEITDPVILDGLSQPGADCTSWPPTLLIELDGSAAGVGVFGLSITGGDSTITGLVIHSFSYSSVHLASNGNNTIACNYLGTDPTGTTALANYHGVNIDDSPGNLIGGGTATSRNLVSGNGGVTVGSGVRIGGAASTGNQIEGNYIGTDSLGTTALGNTNCGVQIDGAPNNIIGGSEAGEGNVISGNGRQGICVTGSSATGTVIRGNYIGTDAGGTQALGNAYYGVHLDGAPNSVIGGTEPNERNLISGNGAAGVRILGSEATGTIIQGNYIGLQSNGQAALPNGDAGVVIEGATNNTIGGTASSAGNVISGNTFSAVSIYGSEAHGNVIVGNYLGTQANGTESLSNGWSGVYILEAPNNIVGGPEAGARNILSGNLYHGVFIGGSSATGNVVQGNHIGTGIDGTENLGNTVHGVFITTGASENQVGGPLEGEANLIANNGGDGVYVDSGTGNLISRNSILANSGLGIDLAPDGVTPNDPGDGDAGANDLQNFPVLNAVIISGGSTVIRGTLDSTPGTTFRLDVYYSAIQDPTDYGEGASYLGAYEVTTDAGGNAIFAAGFPLVLPEASYVTATATDPGNNTSEFGPNCVGPTGVFLVDFQAYEVSQGIQLEWSTATEIGNSGFNLYRATAPDGPRTMLNDDLIEAPEPGSEEGASYTWLDTRARPGVTNYYWLEAVFVDGATLEHGPVSAVLSRARIYLPLVNDGVGQ